MCQGKCPLVILKDTVRYVHEDHVHGPNYGGYENCIEKITYINRAYDWKRQISKVKDPNDKSANLEQLQKLLCEKL